MTGKSIRFLGVGSRWAIVIPVVAIVCAAVAAVIYADWQQSRITHENNRHMVEERLDLVRTKLQGQINANIRLLQGLVSVIGAEPDLTQERFSALAANLLLHEAQLRSIQAAPNLVTAFAYPENLTDDQIGTRIFTEDEELALTRKLREQSRSVVRGPLPLSSGGYGLSIILPVRSVNATAEPVFWGAVTGVIDLARLYDQSGLMTFELPISVVISKVQDAGRTAVIYGDGNIMQQNPVHMAIDFGNDRWTIAAIPVGGWENSGTPSMAFRLVVGSVAATVAGASIWVGLLMLDRQKHDAALRQREEKLKALSHRLGLALEASKIGVWELDVDSGENAWDARMYEMYGLDGAQAMTSDNWLALIHPEDQADVSAKVKLAIRTQMSQSAQFRVLLPGGGHRHLRSFGTYYPNAKGTASVLGVSWDVTEDVSLHEELVEARQRAEQQNTALDTARRRMEYNALHDALTGLPNRRYLDQHLSDIEADPPGQGLAVLHVDLDRFKEINDTLGHGAGDAMLRHVARALRDNVRGEDFVARIGGDEFVVVCLGADADDQFGEMGQRLIAAVNTPTSYAGHECRVGASVGIATRTDASVDAPQLLVNADIALYEAKRLGRNRFERYTELLKARTLNIKKTADAILRSLAADEFIGYYQPQFDAHTLEISGVEALARWNHPEMGILTPDRFLDIADSLSVVSQIDARILEQALSQLSRWQSAALGIDRVSVNISAQRLFDENLVGRLEQLDIKPGSVSFELLESISFDDKTDAVTASLSRLRNLGIEIEIDDFGTGYASILSLLKLSPSRLKIDRELIGPIVDTPAQRRLIASIVDIGRSFGIGIVAEGVETMEHVSILRDLGCQTLQGYALARPMTADALMDFALAHRARRESLLKLSA
ncbi:bifunctional diguanylate cyclase/phosphodiesterase [Rhizobium sp. G187]|uniref:bifunctional diguanylate cyclase/phosphodiesterase n=1 Tax=Rhizobium sp. G187 TaxID=3451352 RepID=UPI003EE44EDE